MSHLEPLDASHQDRIVLFIRAEKLSAKYGDTLRMNCKNYWTTTQVIQNQALRAVLRVPQYTSSNYIHQQLREPKLFDFCSQSTLRYLNNAIQQGNSRILHIIQETVKLKNIVDLPLSPLATSLSAN